MISDERLLELALSGDEASFGELVIRWHSRIYGFIRRYVATAEDAEDLTQNTFAKAYSHLDRLADPASFSSWVYKIALNECRMRFRRQSRLPQFTSVETQALSQVSERTPESRLAEKEIRQVLQAAFANLPEEQRVVILMKEYQGLKFHEIAEICEAPLSTVKSRMYLGLKTLRKLMERQK